MIDYQFQELGGAGKKQALSIFHKVNQFKLISCCFIVVEHKRPRWRAVAQHILSKSQQRFALGPGLILQPVTEKGLALFYLLTAWLEIFNSQSSPFLCCHLFAMEASAAGFVCKSFQFRGWWDMLEQYALQQQNKRNPASKRGGYFPQSK